ncbi:uncharacterized protein LOC126790705 isoform X3 [Argentina anserina]|nr:uncharacterized protein LOC126790705 isoform X3 [Potentilla anserina]
MIPSADGSSSNCQMEMEAANNGGHIDGAIISACDPKQFKRVVKALSKEKINVIVGMGFGPVDSFRCSKLNMPLCRMLIERFDVLEQTINIHGRHLSITEKDFNRLMGLSCRGMEVDLHCSDVDDVVAKLKTKLHVEDDDISVDRLRDIVLSSPDEGEIFIVSFALYALSIMFCPSPTGHVDQQLLIPLRHPQDIRRKNWSRFAYKKLVEGVLSYQRSKGSHVAGCLVFLQLFYLSVLGERTLMIPRIEGPVRSFGRNECNRIYKWIEGLGGFYATEGIWVTKRHTTVRSTTNSGSRDYSTGLKTNLVDDVSDLKRNMAVVKDGVERLESIARQMGPDVAYMRKSLMELHFSVLEKFGEGMEDFVSDVETAVRLHFEKSISGTPVGWENETSHPECNEGTDTLHRDGLPKTNIEVPQDHVKPTPTELCSFGGSKFGSVADLSPEDKDLMAYLFSLKSRRGDILGSSNEIGRYSGFSVSIWDLKCLSAKNCISSEVINLMGAYCFANTDDLWFLPTFFSERAQEAVPETHVESHIASTIALCNLRKLHGQLHACNKIFIPINDSTLEHWYLAVLNIAEGGCEIWDSIPDISVRQRREESVVAVIVLLQRLFAMELQHYPLLSSKLASSSIMYPEINPTQSNHMDSGIFTIRNMQHYRDCWHEGFNSGDQRIRLALEIVNDKSNECADNVRESVKCWKKGFCFARAGPSRSGDASFGDNCDPGLVPSTIKFKPRLPRRS